MTNPNYRFAIGTQGQFDDPDPGDEVLRKFAVDFQKEHAGKFDRLTPDELLGQSIIRQLCIDMYLAEEEDKAEKAAKVEADKQAAKLAAEKAEKATQLAAAEAQLFMDLGFTLEDKRKIVATQWAKAMARALKAGDQAFNFPIVRQHEGNDICGVPDSVGCCDHSPVEKPMYAILPNGEDPYAVCQVVLGIYDALYMASGRTAKVFLYSANKVGLEAKAKYRKERELPVRKFVKDFARLRDLHELEFVPEPKLDANDKHLCAMGGKIPCCDGNQPAHRFPHQQGVVYGWCRNFAVAAWAEFLRIQADVKAGGEGARYAYRLKSKATLDAGQKTADGYNRQQDDNARLAEIARGYAVWDSAISTPEPHLFATGEHGCAAFKAGWGCCDGTKAVERGSVIEGVVRGFCHRSSGAMFRVWLAMQKANEAGGMDQAPNHLRTSSIEQAEEWSERFATRNNNGNNHGNGRSPLGNLTDPEKRARRERNMNVRRDENRERARGGRGKKGK